MCVCLCVCVRVCTLVDERTGLAVQGSDEVTFRGGPGIEITERKP